MKIAAKILVFLILFVHTNLIYGQKNSVQISTQEEYNVTNNELLTITVSLKNNSTADKKVALSLNTNPGIKIISNSQETTLKAGEKAFIPIKLFIEKRHPAGISELHFFVKENNEITSQTKTYLNISSKRELRINTSEPQVIMYKEGDSLVVSAQVYNNGNVVEKAQVTAFFPSLYGSSLTLTKEISIDPFSNKSISFSRIIDRELLKVEIFSVNIAGVSKDKGFFGNTLVTVQNATSNRRYSDPSQSGNLFFSPYPNHIRIGSRNTFSPHDATWIWDSHTEFNSPILEGSLNVNALWREEQENPLYLSNTFLELKRNKISSRLGTLNTSGLERNLYGRGLSFSLDSYANENSKVTVGILDKSYNLIDPFRSSNLYNGYSAYGVSSIAIDEKSALDQSILFDQENNQQHLLVMNAYRYRNLKNTTSLEAKLGYGHSVSQQLSQEESSFAGGLDWKTIWGKYHFNSNTYYSTGYYPGTRRGNTFIDQRVSRYFTNFSVWASLNYNKYKPLYITYLPFGAQESEQITVETGTQIQLNPQTSFGVSTRWRDEKSDVFFPASMSMEAVTFRTGLLNTILNYTTKSYHLFSLSLQSGYSEFLNLAPVSFSYRGQLSWNHKSLGLNISYQKGNLMLYEGINTGDFSEKTEKVMGFINANHSMFNKKLNLQVNGMFSYDLQSGKNIGLSTALDYQIFKKTSIQASYSRTQYYGNYYQGGYSYYQMAVVQSLPSIGEKTTSYKNGNLEVFLYRDLNNNRIYDPLIDEIASETKISINNTIFITDQKGKVMYRKIPYGTYKIRPMDKMWYAALTETETNQKNNFLSIPLEKAGLVRGNLQYETTGKHQYEVYAYYAGIPIVFTDLFQVQYTLYANENGQFHGYLPAGKYTIKLDSKGLQKNVFTEKEIYNLEIKPNATNSLETILLKVKEKKVEVRKFGS